MYERYKSVLILKSITLSLLYPKEVAKLPNLVKYCVCFLSCFLLFLGTSLLHLLGSSLLLPRAQQVVSEHPRFVVRSCVDSKNIDCYLAEIVCRSQSSIGTVCGILCQSQNSVYITQGIRFDEVNHFRNSSRVSL